MSRTYPEFFVLLLSSFLNLSQLSLSLSKPTLVTIVLSLPNPNSFSPPLSLSQISYSRWGSPISIYSINTQLFFLFLRRFHFPRILSEMRRKFLRKNNYFSSLKGKTFLRQSPLRLIVKNLARHFPAKNLKKTV